jgi:tetratricopeptide (TPR) repeat protein
MVDQSSSRSRSSSEGWLAIGLPLLVAVLSFATFAPSLDGEFVNLDDRANFTTNLRYRGLGAAQLRWMFTHFAGHYQPITWLSHGVDFVLWGMDPRGYHLVNLAVHAANAVLVYLLFLDLLPNVRPLSTMRGSNLLRCAAAVGALVFAVHPLRVESVAWITERRDVLFLFFALLSMLSYVRAQARRAAGASPLRWLTVSVACFVLSFLSKAMCMTLPFLLLLIDAYPLRRLGDRAGVRTALIEKTPYLAVMVAGIVAQLIAQHLAQAIDPESSYTIGDMLSQPAYRLNFYLWKIVLPIGLHPMYVLPIDRNPLSPDMLLCAAGIVAISLALLLLARRAPALLTAWLAFALLLAPVLGLVQVGHHFASDRNTYFAGIVPAALLAGGLARLWQRRRVVWPSAGAAIALVTVYSGLSYQQSKIWLTTTALWEHTIARDPENHIAQYNLAHEYAAAESFDLAIDHYTRAIYARDDEPSFWYNRGTCWLARGKSGRALSDFDRAIELDPSIWMAFGSRAGLKLQRGDFVGAVDDYTRVIALEPGMPRPYEGRARAYAGLGDEAAARADRERSRKLHQERRPPSLRSKPNLRGRLARPRPTAARIAPENASPSPARP